MTELKQIQLELPIFNLIKPASSYFLMFEEFLFLLETKEMTSEKDQVRPTK